MMTNETMINWTYSCSDGLDSINISVITVNRIGLSSPVNKTLEIQNGNANSGKVLTLEKCIFVMILFRSWPFIILSSNNNIFNNSNNRAFILYIIFLIV